VTALARLSNSAATLGANAALSFREDRTSWVSAEHTQIAMRGQNTESASGNWTSNRKNPKAWSIEKPHLAEKESLVVGPK